MTLWTLRVIWLRSLTKTEDYPITYWKPIHGHVGVSLRDFFGRMNVEEPFKELKQFVSELMAYNPRKRPPLHSWKWSTSMPAQKWAKVKDNMVEI